MAKKLIKQAQESFEAKDYIRAKQFAKKAVTEEKQASGHLIIIKAHLLKSTVASASSASSPQDTDDLLELLEALITDIKSITKPALNQFIKDCSELASASSEKTTLEYYIARIECLASSEKDKNQKQIKMFNKFKEYLNTFPGQKAFLHYLQNLELNDSVLTETRFYSILHNVIYYPTTPKFCSLSEILILLFALKYLEKRNWDKLQSITKDEISSKFIEKFNQLVGSLGETLDQKRLDVTIILASLCYFNEAQQGAFFEHCSIEQIKSSFSLESDTHIYLELFYYLNYAKKDYEALLVAKDLQGLATLDQKTKKKIKNLSKTILENADEELKEKFSEYFIEPIPLSNAEPVRLVNPETEVAGERDTISNQFEVYKNKLELAKQGSIEMVQELVSDNHYLAISMCYQLAVNLEERTDLSPQERSEIENVLYQQDKRKDRKDALLRRAISACETALKKDEENTYFYIAMLRYEGIVFQKNNFIARDLLTLAIENKQIGAHFLYAKMIYQTEGGPFNFKEAREHFELAMKEPLSTENYGFTNFALGNIYSVLALVHPEHSQHFWEQAINCYVTITKQGKNGEQYLNALLSIYILAVYDNCEIARERLKEILQDKEIRACLEEQKNILLDEIIGSEEVEDELLSFDELAQNPAKNLSVIDLLERIKSDFKQEDIHNLQQYYANQSNGFLKLLTTICYCSKRYPVDSTYLKNLHSILHKLNNIPGIKLYPELTQETLNDYYEQLKNKETEANTYFDDCLSEISDEGDELKRQGTDGKQTTDCRIQQSAINKLEKKALDEIGRLQKILSVLPEKEEKAIMMRVKSTFVGCLEECSVKRLSSQQRIKLQQEINVLNKAKAEGNLSKALIEIDDHYVVALTRGHHMSTEQWNQDKRQYMRRAIVQHDHPWVDQTNKVPLYASAVYEQAGVTDFTDISPLTLLRLSRACLFLKVKLEKLKELPLDQASLEAMGFDKETVNDLLPRASTKTRAQQVQQLYTNRYTLFHNFTKALKTNPQPELPIPTQRNIFCSFGRLTSDHSSRYSNGTKYYDEKQKEERLRPNWGADLTPHRHITGYVILALFPLEDFASRNVHDVVTLANEQAIHVKEAILREQEVSFLLEVGAGRVKYIDLSKYPSFNRGHSSIHRVKYSLSPKLYKAFKDLFASSKPHEPKRRLATLLLGAYLSAAQNLFLREKAQQHAKEKILLFLDRYGMFCLNPASSLSPHPNGYEHDLINRRYASARKRGRFSEAEEMPEEDIEEEQALPIEGESDSEEEALPTQGHSAKMSRY